MDSLFIQAVPIIERIEQAGYEAYFVGGSVRDQIIGRAIHDVDIATSATPGEIKAIFPRTVDVGIEHGTVLVIEKHGSYEITTFRTESGYSDFRRPDEVRFVRSLTEDLMRRDFTMNSMAMDKNGNIIDPFGGQKAIMDKRIVTVGNSYERFHEDALRMMRAIRFVSQLGFTLDSETLRSLQENGALLKHIAIERVHAEFEKLLAGPYRVQGLQLLVQSELYKYIPRLHNQKDTLKQLTALPIDTLSVSEIWALLLIQGRVEDVSSFLRDWRLPVKQIKAIQRVVFFADKPSSFVEHVYDLFEIGLSEGVQAAKVRAVVHGDSVSDAEALVRKKYADLVIKDMSELTVGGADLLVWRNVNPGPWLKEYLQMIVTAVLKREVENDKQKIKEWLVQCNLM
ncbi:CCA tRNA nucleotidyltransferase [Peribacillus sp. Hz7]|uniref:CCA tRNA nucleotidyltransferase n=1 Tax=Peribacillus sp. Hz7 TaxID=3344873 RepID=UPI0035CC13A8